MQKCAHLCETSVYHYSVVYTFSCLKMSSCFDSLPLNYLMCDDIPCRYADRAKQIVCKAVVNEDPNAKVRFKIV